MLRRDFLAAGLAAWVPSLALAAGEDLGARASLDGEAGTATAARVAQAASLAVTPAEAQGRYAALVDQDFLFYPGGRGVKLTLVRVITPALSKGSTLHQFSLLFTGAPGRLPSGLYEVDAPGMARQLMQIEWLGGSATAVQYRADFALL